MGSVKDYINSGLDKKVVDPDGVIHCQRLRAEKENRKTTAGKLPCQVAKQGLVKRKEICQSSSTVLYSLSDASKEGEKSRGAFRCKMEGYVLFKASHVQDVKYNFSDGNEFEPFDSNFSNDLHLLISHSVLITPEDNPKGNQEKQFEADCQEEPTEKKLLMKHHKLQKMEILVLWK